MGNSKIILGDETLIDLTSDTVTAATLLAGITAHGADGSPITGTAIGGKLATGEENLETDTSSIEWDLGQDFTPNGYIMMRIGTSASITTQEVGSSKLIGYLRIGGYYWTIHTSQNGHSFRTAKGSATTSFQRGKIIYSTSTASYNLSAGRWKWLAWATD